MAERSVRIIKLKPSIRILRGSEILSFLLLASTINVYVLDEVLPSYTKGIVIMIGFLFLFMYNFFICKKFDGYIIPWAMYSLWLCFSNLMNSENLIWAVNYPVKVVTFIMLNKMYLDRRNKNLLRMMRHYITILLIINFAIQMIDQDMFGYTNAHNFINFFESDNYLGWYYVPYIALCVILDFIEKNKVRKITYIEIGLCTASIIRAWVGKTLVALCFVIIYILFVYRKKIALMLTPKLLAAGFITIDVGIVFFGMQKMVSTSLYDILGKDVTISGRVIIWASAIKNILKSPIWGHGIAHGGDLYINLGPGHQLMPAHNIFLEVAIQGGIVGVILYLIILIVLLRAGAKESRKSLKKLKYRYEYLFLIFIIFMMFSMAVFSNPQYIPFFYLPMVLLISFESLIQMYETNQGRRTEIRDDTELS